MRVKAILRTRQVGHIHSNEFNRRYHMCEVHRGLISPGHGVPRSRRPINTAPRDGTLIRLWCRSEAEPVIGYWSRTFIGWVAYHEDIPVVRHDVTGWEPIAD